MGKELPQVNWWIIASHWNIIDLCFLSLLLWKLLLICDVCRQRLRAHCPFILSVAAHLKLSVTKTNDCQLKGWCCRRDFAPERAQPKHELLHALRLRLQTHTHTQIQTHIPEEKLKTVQHFHWFTGSIIVTFHLNGKYDCLMQLRCV